MIKHMLVMSIKIYLPHLSHIRGKDEIKRIRVEHIKFSAYWNNLGK